MANPTTNYSFAMPTNSDLVKDLPADFEVFGQAVDTQMKTNADAAIAKTIVDAKGDLIAATAADTVGRLAVGANDTVLTADSTTATGLKWATVASGGMTQIATGSLSGASTTISSIPTTYKRLVLECNGFYPSSTNVNIRMRVNGDSTSQFYGTFSLVESTPTSNNYADQFDIPYANSCSNSATYAAYHVFNCDFLNPTASNTKIINYTRYHVENGTPAAYNLYGLSGTGRYSGLSAITSITLFFSAGNIAGGTYILYGVK